MDIDIFAFEIKNAIIMKIINYIVILFLSLLTLSCSDSTEKLEEVIPEVKPEEQEKPKEEEELPEELEDTTTLVLNVDGRYLKDNKGKIVNLHGF